jgi:hypothetical protein
MRGSTPSFSFLQRVPTILIYILGVLPLIAMAGIGQIRLGMDDLIILLIASLVFATHTQLFDSISSRHGMGTGGSIALSIWFLYGLPITATVVTAGALISSIVRFIAYRHNFYKTIERALYSMAFAAITVIPAVLLGRFLGYPGTLLLSEDNLIEAAIIVIAGLAAAQSLNSLIVGTTLRIPPIILLVEVIAAMMVIPLVIVAQQTNGIIFAMFTVLLAMITLIPSLQISQQANDRHRVDVGEISRIMASKLMLNELTDEIINYLRNVIPGQVTFISVYTPDYEPIITYRLADGTTETPQNIVQMLASV